MLRCDSPASNRLSYVTAYHIESLFHMKAVNPNDTYPIPCSLRQCVNLRDRMRQRAEKIAQLGDS
jgi:hypothetical protein